MQRINIVQAFQAPVTEVFARLADHEEFGRIVGAPNQRIREGDKEVNGVGSIRRIQVKPLPAFEETVTAFEPDRLIEYCVSRGSPIKDHRGRMRFSEQDGVTTLTYDIEFNAKLSLPLWPRLLCAAIERPIRQGLARMALDYRQ